MYVWGRERGGEREFMETIPMKNRHELSYRNSNAKAPEM